jgi:TRAP transporter TAXI family solute receptor
MNRRALGLLSLLVAGVLVLGSCGGGRSLVRGQVRRSVVLSTGADGSVASAWGQQLAKEFRSQSGSRELIAETSSGNVANLRRLTIGSADLALTTVDALDPDPGEACVRQTAAGAEDQRRVPLVALARIYDDYLQVVTRADSPVRSIADLAGRKVAVGLTGSGTALAACRVLETARVKVKPLALEPEMGLRALESDDVDAVFWLGEQVQTQGGDAGRLRLVPLGNVAAAVARKYDSVYRAATVPVGGNDDNAVTTVATSMLLIGRSDVEDQTVDDVLRVIFGHRDAMVAAVPAAEATERRSAVFTGGLALHPAAERYYQETKP